MDNMLGAYRQFLLYHRDSVDVGVLYQIERVESDMLSMRDFLGDVEKSLSNELRGQSARYVAGFVYRCENLLEALNITISRETDPYCNTFRSLFRSRPSLQEDLLREIFTIKEQIPFALSQSNRNNFLPDELGSGYDRPYEFVGREEETKLLLSYLCSEEEACGIQVISISGMRGIGKTMLAKQLYEHREVKKEYVRLWVRVSGNFSKRSVVEAIAEQLFNREYVLTHNWSALEGLAREILFHLEKTKTLIVLDGISSVNQWESLKVILLRINTPSSTKVLITTRLKEVAAQVCWTNTARRIHLTRLTDYQGCQLLVNHARENLGDTIREDLAKTIVNYCGSLPFTIFSFLRCIDTNQTVEGWKDKVNETLNSSVSKRLDNREIQKMLEAVVPMYYDLPLKIRPLFLYMGALQQDVGVEVEKLSLLSLADGILQPLQARGRGEEGGLLDVSERILIDLYEREEPEISRFKYCQLSGLMWDLSLLKSKDEGFIEVLDFSQGTQAVLDSSFSPSRSRRFRAVINLDDYKEGCFFPLEDHEMKHMRGLIFIAKKKKFWPTEFSSLAKFTYLKILDFDGIDFEQSNLPKGIERAAHLRYLSFKDCILPKLPSWVANLKLLCILDLRVQHSTVMIIPNVLWKIKKLSHLYFPVLFKTQNGRKLRLDGLTALETITNVNAGMIRVDGILALPKLQYLHLIVHGDLEEIESIAIGTGIDANVDRPQISLDIRNFDCYTEKRHSTFRKLLACQFLTVLYMEGHIRCMPIHHNISRNLTKIVFIGSEMIEDPMKVLEKLPKLQVLILDDAFYGEEIVCAASGFVELKILELLNLQCLKQCIVDDGAMPQLSTLTITNCAQLQKLPQVLHRLPCLREIKVSHMPHDFGEGFERLIRRI